MKYCVENEIFGHLESIINDADRMTSGNFMHNKNAIKILHLPLKAKWFNMQESGEKPEEYREITPYWIKRMVDTHSLGQKMLCNMPDQAAILIRIGCVHIKDYTHVLLRYGYTQRCIVRRIDSITIGRGNPEWGAPTDRDVFIIKHHKKDVIVDESELTIKDEP